MDNTEIYATVIYLLTYRLATLFLSGMSIYLGFRLFVEGFDRKNNATDEVSAKFGSATLTLKNAAPGTFFAVFGAAITIVTLMGNPPEFNRSVERDHASGLVKKTLNARGSTASQLHEQLWNQHYAEVIKLAKQVVELDLDNPDYRDTLAALYFAKGKFSDAVEQQEIALKNAKNSNVKPAGLVILESKRDIYRQFLD